MSPQISRVQGVARDQPMKVTSGEGISDPQKADRQKVAACKISLEVLCMDLNLIHEVFEWKDLWHSQNCWYL